MPSFIELLSRIFGGDAALAKQADKVSQSTGLPPIVVEPPKAAPAVAPAAPTVAKPATSPTVYDPLTAQQRKTAQAIIQIFETGRLSAKSYGAVSNAVGDAGGLSYGTHQVSLMSGNLYLLLRSYVDRGGVQAKRISPFLDRIADKDRAVGASAVLQSALRDAGSDPIMKAVQDEYFDANFWRPSARDAQARKFVTPLAYALSFDGHIQGGWGRIAPRVPNTLKEKDWCRTYVAERRRWLANGHGLVPKTVYRMDEFSKLIAANNWDLKLPIVIRGVKIGAENLV